MTSIDTPDWRGGKKPLPEVRDDVWLLQQALRTAALSRKLAAALQAGDATAAARFAAAGHEAIQLALAVQLRPGVDRAFLYHRDQAALLQLGVSAEAWLQAVQGSDAQVAFAWPSGRPDGLIWQRAPQPDFVRDAVAAAAAIKAAGSEAVVALSVGDGLAATGAFHEILTWAARERLPTIFIIQDNHASAGLASRQVLANSSIFDLTAGYRNLERFRVDGSDFQQCRLALEAAYRQAVRRKGPALIVADVDALADFQLTLQPTLPGTTSSGQRDPMARLVAELRERMDELELTDWLADLEGELNSVVEKAASAVVRTSVAVGSPAPADMDHVLCDDEAADTLFLWPHPPDGDPLLETLLRRDLAARIRYLPHSGELLVAAIMAFSAAGQRVVASCDDPALARRMLQAMSQKRDVAGEVILRLPTARMAAAPETMPWQTLDWPVVYPADAEDARALLRWQRQAERPLVFLEHPRLHQSLEAAIFARATDDRVVQPGIGRLVRQGEEVTLVTAGAAAGAVLAAADRLASAGIGVEVIVLPALRPYDRELIKTSVSKTSRLLMALEAWLDAGFGAAMAAELFQQCFYVLDAPISLLPLSNADMQPEATAEDVAKWLHQQ